MKPFLTLMLVFLSTVATAQVYRSIDDNGDVVFSDEPTEGAEEIQLKEPTTVESLAVDPLPPYGDRRGAEDKLEYRYELSISSPADDEAVRENAGNITVSASIKPDLFEEHALVLYLDGREYATSKSPVFQLQGLDRGTHTVRISVKDGKGRILNSSKTVTFHLLRHSVLHKSP